METQPVSGRLPDPNFGYRKILKQALEAPDRWTYSDIAIEPPKEDEFEQLSLYHATSGGEAALKRKALWFWHLLVPIGIGVFGWFGTLGAATVNVTVLVPVLPAPSLHVISSVWVPGLSVPGSNGELQLVVDPLSSLQW